MLSSGIDIVEIKRIEKVLEKRKYQFYNKIFTEKEISYMESKNNNPRTVAGIFSAKESVSKALGTGIGKIAWKDLEIVHDSKGKPRVSFNESLSKLLKDLGFNSIEVSISHEKHYALSMAICFYNPIINIKEE